MTARKFVEMARTGNLDTLEFLDRFLKAWDSVRSRGKKSIYLRYQVMMGTRTEILICCTFVSIVLGIIIACSETLYLKRTGVWSLGVGFITIAVIFFKAFKVNVEFNHFISTIKFIEEKCGFGPFQSSNLRWQSRGTDFVNNIRVPMIQMCQDIASGQLNTIRRDEANRRRKELARMYQDILVLTKEARKWEDGTFLSTDRDLPKDLGGFFPKS